MVYIHTSVCLEICNVLVLSCTTVSVRSKQSGLPKFNASTHTHKQTIHCGKMTRIIIHQLDLRRKHLLILRKNLSNKTPQQLSDV